MRSTTCATSRRLLVSQALEHGDTQSIERGNRRVVAKHHTTRPRKTQAVADLSVIHASHANGSCAYSPHGDRDEQVASLPAAHHAVFTSRRACREKTCARSVPQPQRPDSVPRMEVREGCRRPSLTVVAIRRSSERALACHVLPTDQRAHPHDRQAAPRYSLVLLVALACPRARCGARAKRRICRRISTRSSANRWSELDELVRDDVPTTDHAH